MNVGLKSVLFGAHQFLIHPFYLFLSWTQLYGFPRDPRLWIAFFVHDLGYAIYNTPNMDGAEGERHVEWGAKFMGLLFGKEWYEFCLYHSRFYSQAAGEKFSRLCVADKLAFCNTPDKLYLLCVRLSGEYKEYIAKAPSRGTGTPAEATIEEWYEATHNYLYSWALRNKNNARPDRFR